MFVCLFDITVLLGEYELLAIYSFSLSVVLPVYLIEKERIAKRGFPILVNIKMKSRKPKT